ncbi:hypothetical protein NDU88_005536 [Pleurodeles waltl]|uniref:Uncharacterized protein n=1 Tax=Pleurodeles waltl TaxID=8319 RepID=A0AAV7UIG4_PLEWA|nr:hypothetical protein NDU88_005536 [Pleurodeles waltl]
MHLRHYLMSGMMRQVASITVIRVEGNCTGAAFIELGKAKLPSRQGNHLEKSQKYPAILECGHHFVEVTRWLVGSPLQPTQCETRGSSGWLSVFEEKRRQGPAGQLDQQGSGVDDNSKKQRSWGGAVDWQVSGSRKHPRASSESRYGGKVGERACVSPSGAHRRPPNTNILNAMATLRSSRVRPARRLLSSGHTLLDYDEESLEEGEVWEEYGLHERKDE